MRIRGLVWILPLLLFGDAARPSDQPPAASPQFLAGIEYDYGNRYAAGENYEQAIHYYRRSLAIFASPEVFNSLGIVCMAVERYADAIDAFREATRLRPREAQFHYNLGFAYEAADQVEEAAPAYGESLRLDPRQPAAHQALGEVLHDLGLYDEAIAAFREAMRLEPQEPKHRLGIATSQASLGRWDAAVAELEIVLRADPDSERAQSDMGDALVMLGRMPEALTAYEHAARLAPGNALNHHKVAGAYRSAKRLVDARSSYLEVLRLEPDNANAAFELGQVCLGLDSAEQALAAFELASRLKPQADDLLFWHATTLLLLGRRDEAEQIHARLLTINAVAADRLRQEIDRAGR
jgi:tetratricopeptide (TPR) repeat protein